MNFNKERTALPVELIFIPDYIVSALKSKGISIQDLDNALKGELHRYVNGLGTVHTDINGDRLVNSNCKNILESKLSRVDIEDLLVFNDPTILKLQNTEDSKFREISFMMLAAGSGIKYKQENVSNTLLTLYSNDMSSGTKVIDTVIGTDALYVVLHKGFSNYLIDNDFELQYNIFSSLVDKVLISFGEGRYLSSPLSRQYLRMIWRTYKINN